MLHPARNEPETRLIMRLDRIPALVGRTKNLRVVVETPRGSRLKYDYDPDLKHIVLKKTLPEGMAFPYDFGFIPGTKGEDGDPLDVLVLMDVSTCPGCITECRLVGLMEAEQTEDSGKKLRNDRFLAVEKSSLLYERIRDVKDLPPKFADQLEEFFVAYNKLEGRRFKPRQLLGAKAAWKVFRRALRQ
jgi:inorganic pyrophosphatase